MFARTTKVNENVNSKSNKPGKVVQAQLTVGAVNDPLEKEADQVADQIMRMPEQGVVQRKCAKCEEEDKIQRKPLVSFIQKKGDSGGITASESVSGKIQQTKGKGRPLPRNTRSFMESRLGADFGNVSVHTGRDAMQMSKELNAKAFTIGNDIYFNSGQYSPDSNSGKQLLAHELTHTIQQNGKDTIQRVVELRPPGPGEATAFDRRQELIDRMNAVSLAVSYSLAADERTMQYQILLPSAVSNFDTQMMGFIDHEQVIPMRLITSSGTVGGFPIVGDSFLHGYVDLDDLMASDDYSFQSILVHFLEERAVTNRYAQRIGSPSLDASTPVGRRAFQRGHRAGHEAQERHWQDVMGDSSIRFSRERIRNNGDAHIIFRSTTHNYNIFITLRRAATSAAGQRPRFTTGGISRVRYNNQWYSIEDFLNLGIVPGRHNTFRLRLGVGARSPFTPSFGIPPLQINQQIFNLRSLRRTTLPTLGPNLPAPQPSGASSGSTFSPNLLTPPSLGPGTNQIDWFAIQRELTSRGVFLDDPLSSSIVDTWMSNYRFFNSTLGLGSETSITLTNMTISRAVGSGLSVDFPTMGESSDRELGISSTILPLSDIVLFLVNSARE